MVFAIWTWLGGLKSASTLQRPLHALHAITLDDVAGLHVLVVFEGHAAFLAGDDFARVILEALELRQLTLMHDHAVANEPDIGATLDDAVGDAAAGDAADLRDLEDFENDGIAEHGLAQRRRQQARHRLLHVVDQGINDVVVTDFDAGLLGGLARLLVGADVEADDGGARGFRQRDVGFGNAADPGIDHAREHFIGGHFVQRAGDGFDRALDIALDPQREFLAAGSLELTHHLLERTAHAGLPRRHFFALLPDAIIGDLAGAGFGIDNRKPVAGFRCAVEAQYLDRHRRAGGDHGMAGIRHQCAHAAPFGAGDDDVAGLERAALNQDGGDRPAAAVKPRLDHGAFGRAARIGFEFQHFRLQRDDVEQLVEIGFCFG